MNINVNEQKDSFYYCSAYSSKRQDGGIDEKAKVKNGTVFVGDMKGTIEDNIFQKKIEAQRKAIKTVLDQFTEDLKVSDYIQDCNEQKDLLQAEADEILEKMNEILDTQEELANTYGVTADSDEMKNLELLRKSVNEPEKLTKAEKEQLANIGPLTEFQEQVLSLDEMKDTYQERLVDLNRGVRNQTATVIAIKIEAMKSHGMADAQKEASDLMQQASKTVINQLIDLAKDKVDDEVEEAKEKQEEKVKQEEASTEENSTDSTRLSQISSDFTQVQNEVQSMATKNLLLEEDIKGILMDETI